MFRKEYTPKYECHVLTAAAAGLIGAGLSTAGVMGQTAFNAASSKKQREWSEKMWNAQNAWNLEMWDKTNEYNSPEQQVQRLRDAGLNPLYYGLDGSSANGLEAGQPLGYERAEAPNFGNPAAEGFAIYAQQKSLEKDIELKNAQIDKLGADTESVKLDNEWKDKTMDARVESENIANDISKETLGKIKDERGKIQQEVKKLIAETDNEVLKGMLIEAQTNLAKMQEKQIAELLPYEKLLKQAQTEAQKAAAAASFAKAAIDKGLFAQGYVEKVIDGLDKDNKLKDANIKSAEARAALDNFKAAIRSGNTFSIEDDDWFVSKAGKQVLNAFFQDLCVIGDVVGAPLSGLFK